MKGHDATKSWLFVFGRGISGYKPTKKLMTSLLNAAMLRKQIIFPFEDLEVEDQVTTHTHTGGL